MSASDDHQRAVISGRLVKYSIKSTQIIEVLVLDTVNFKYAELVLAFSNKSALNYNNPVS